MIPKNGHVIPKNDHVIPVNDNVIHKNGYVIPKNGHVIPKNGLVIPSSLFSHNTYIPTSITWLIRRNCHVIPEHVFPKNGHVISFSDYVIPMTGHVIPVSDQVIPMNGHVIPVQRLCDTHDQVTHRLVTSPSALISRLVDKYTGICRVLDRLGAIHSYISRLRNVVTGQRLVLCIL